MRYFEVELIEVVKGAAKIGGLSLALAPVELRSSFCKPRRVNSLPALGLRALS